MLTRRLFPLVVSLVLVLAIACQTNLSEDDIDRMADAMVDALMENPTYLDYLESDEWVEQFTDALLSNPKYQEYLETTTEEDCAAIILTATVISGDYGSLPRDHEVAALCTWYQDQVN